MGILDKAKGLVSGHEQEVSDGIDQAADVVKDKVGHDEAVDKGVEVVEDALGIDDTTTTAKKKKS